MGVKTARGGKYHNQTTPSPASDKRGGNEMEVTVVTITNNGKTYYALKRLDNGILLKSAPIWRNSKSPIKYAAKHHLNVV